MPTATTTSTQTSSLPPQQQAATEEYFRTLLGDQTQNPEWTAYQEGRNYAEVQLAELRRMPSHTHNQDWWNKVNYLVNWLGTTPEPPRYLPSTGGATGLMQQPIQYADVAGLTPDELEAMRMIRNQAGITNPLWQQGEEAIGGMLKYDPSTDPAFQTALNRAIGQSTRQVLTNAQRTGNRASTGTPLLAGEATGQAAATMYQPTLQYRQNAAGMIPSFTGERQRQGLQMSGALAGIGAQERGINQQMLDLNARRVNEPWARLQNYQGLMTGNYGGTTSTTGTQQTPYYEPPLWQTLAGLGIAGLGAARGR